MEKDLTKAMYMRKYVITLLTQETLCRKMMKQF